MLPTISYIFANKEIITQEEEVLQLRHFEKKFSFPLLYTIARTGKDRQRR